MSRTSKTKNPVEEARRMLAGQCAGEQCAYHFYQVDGTPTCALASYISSDTFVERPEVCPFADHKEWPFRVATISENGGLLGAI